jgi:hypothetical protein
MNSFEWQSLLYIEIRLHIVNFAILYSKAIRNIWCASPLIQIYNKQWQTCNSRTPVTMLYLMSDLQFKNSGDVVILDCKIQFLELYRTVRYNARRLSHVPDMDTGFDCGVFHLLNLDNRFCLPLLKFEMRLTAGVTGQLRMLTPLSHLILP